MLWIRVTALVALFFCLLVFPNQLTQALSPSAETQFSCASVSEIPQLECEALIALYESTDGPNWDNTTGWLETNTPCSWYGVKCVDGSVDTLALTNENPNDLFGLQGALPAQIGNLKNLKHLNLYDNQLDSLPTEIGNLTNLTNLWLSGNQLSSLPAGIGNLENLRYLYIDSNQLSSLPTTIGNLDNLINLFLIGNQLSNLPAEIGNLESLINLRLQNNRLSSLPATMGNLNNLLILRLSDNQLSNLPATIGNIESLDDLWLDYNQLTSVPITFANLTNMITLKLEHNRLTATDEALLGWMNTHDSDWAETQNGETHIPNMTKTPTNTPTQTPTPTPPPTPMPDLPEDDAWGIMIYLNGDNDLSKWTRRLFNELELAVYRDPSLRIRVLWDLEKEGDTVLYHVQPDDSVYDLANYQEGTTQWSQGELNMGDRETLLDFILTSRQDLSTERYLLSIVDHGGGWSPSLPAGQPPGRRWAAGASGFSWDETDGHSYLSTEDMGYIFSHPQLVQDPIDVVFYDACLMAMLEEAFEIRNGARYLVASQNETFTTFPYSRYLENIESRSPRQQAVWLVDNYYESLERDQYARTLSALDLQQVGELKDAVSTFAMVISEILVLNDERITTEYIGQIFSEVQKLDYNYDLIIEDTEGYVDLGDFVSRIIAGLSEPGTSEIVQAGQDVLDALKDGQNPFVIYERHASGYTSLDTAVEVDNVTGLSVYLPLGEEDPDLRFYLSSQIDYVTEGFWDEFIMEYLGPVPQSGGSNPAGGRGNQPSPIAIIDDDHRIYMPLIVK